jgi:hypothetical protein
MGVTTNGAQAADFIVVTAPADTVAVGQKTTSGSIRSVRWARGRPRCMS